MNDLLSQRAQQPLPQKKSAPLSQDADSSGVNWKRTDESLVSLKFEETRSTYTPAFATTHTGAKRSLVAEIDSPRSGGPNSSGNASFADRSRPSPGPVRGPIQGSLEDVGLRWKAGDGAFCTPPPPELRLLATRLAENFVPFLAKIALGSRIEGHEASTRREARGDAGYSTSYDTSVHANPTSSIDDAPGNSGNSSSRLATNLIATEEPIPQVASPTTLTGSAAEGALALVRICALIASVGPGMINEAREHTGHVAQDENTAILTEALKSHRREALRVMGVLAPETTLALLSLAESWLGGNGPGTEFAMAGENAAGGTRATSSKSLPSDWSQHIYGPPLCDAVNSNRYGGSLLAKMSPAGLEPHDDSYRATLAARAVHDLKDLVAEAVDNKLRLQEFEAAMKRVRERDGLDGEILWECYNWSHAALNSTPTSFDSRNVSGNHYATFNSQYISDKQIYI